jgi:hypothetical protein
VESGESIMPVGYKEPKPKELKGMNLREIRKLAVKPKGRKRTRKERLALEYVRHRDKEKKYPDAKGHPTSARERKLYAVSHRKNGDRKARVSVNEGTISLLENPDQVKEWSDLELMNGYRGVRGARPNFIPREVHQELARRIMSRVQLRFLAQLEHAIDMNQAIIDGIEIEMVDGHPIAVNVTPVQQRAIQEVIERVMGKAHEQIDVVVDTPAWQRMAARAIVGSIDQLEDVVEGEVIEEDAG